MTTQTRTAVAMNPLFMATTDGETLQIFGFKKLAIGYIESLSGEEIKKVTVDWRKDKEVPGIEIAERTDAALRMYMDKMVEAALAWAGARITTFAELTVGDLFDSTSKACYQGKFTKEDKGHASTFPGGIVIAYDPDTKVIYLPNADVNFWND